MNSELQMVVDRLELVERQSRSWKITAGLALVLAAASMTMWMTARPSGLPDRARFSVVEANRILLRDTGGSIAGGLESTSDGTLRLVLGSPASASAHLVVHGDGDAELALRSREGHLRAVVHASDRPFLSLIPDRSEPAVALRTREDGGGELLARDGAGRLRFRAP